MLGGAVCAKVYLNRRFLDFGKETSHTLHHTQEPKHPNTPKTLFTTTITMSSINPRENERGQGASHAKPGESIVPESAQRNLPQSVEERVPNTIHDTGYWMPPPLPFENPELDGICMLSCGFKARVAPSPTRNPVDQSFRKPSRKRCLRRSSVWFQMLSTTLVIGEPPTPGPTETKGVMYRELLLTV